jgi:hypothetical protein
LVVGDRTYSGIDCIARVHKSSCFLFPRFSRYGDWVLTRVGVSKVETYLVESADVGQYSLLSGGSWGHTSRRSRVSVPEFGIGWRLGVVASDLPLIRRCSETCS